LRTTTVLGRHAHDQRPDLLHDGRPSATTTRAAIGLLGDEPAVSRQQRIRRHDRGEFVQTSTSDRIYSRWSTISDILRHSSFLPVGEILPTVGHPFYADAASEFMFAQALTPAPPWADYLPL
jgi:hypothetical protein